MGVALCLGVELSCSSKTHSAEVRGQQVAKLLGKEVVGRDQSLHLFAFDRSYK